MAEVLGHALALMDPRDDVNLALSSPEWERKFQSVAITRDDWRALTKDGVDEAMRKIVFGGLVGEAEEAWFEAHALLRLCDSLDDKASPDTRRVLSALSDLAHDAAERRVHVILSL